MQEDKGKGFAERRGETKEESKVRSVRECGAMRAESVVELREIGRAAARAAAMIMG